VKYRVLDAPWHLGHQYEMLKFPFVKWSWLLDYTRNMDTSKRGDLGSLVEWVPYYEPGRYDAVLLHLDQGCADSDVRSRGKWSLFHSLNRIIRGIPKIVIMHGTPHAPESFANSSDLIAAVRSIVGSNYMVVNSYRAAQQWGWGRVIIHGMHPHEWFDLPKVPRVVTTLSQSGLPSYYDRPFLRRVKKVLAGRGIGHCQIGVDYVSQSWTAYRTFLGRSLLYFNPTREAPMPRARTEAMLSGCCVLTTPNQDADTFIRDGANGFLVPRDPVRVADLIEELIEDPARAIAVGQAGKHTAVQAFHWERYAREWAEYLSFVISDFKNRNT
jgi:Glycosyl transferases group 1